MPEITLFVTVREFRKAVLVGMMTSVIFGVSLIIEVFTISRNSAQTDSLRATNTKLHNLECSVNANMLQGLSERRKIEASTTFPAVEGDIQKRRLAQFDQSKRRLERIALECRTNDF